MHCADGSHAHPVCRHDGRGVLPLELRRVCIMTTDRYGIIGGHRVAEGVHAAQDALQTGDQGRERLRLHGRNREGPKPAAEPVSFTWGNLIALVEDEEARNISHIQIPQDILDGANLPIGIGRWRPIRSTSAIRSCG